MIDRRGVLTGVAALALAGPWRAAAAENDLRAVLDAAQAERLPARALQSLAAFDAVRLAPSARLDVLTARAGLRVDAEIVQRFTVDPRAKGPPRDPTHAALILRRKLGDGIDPAAARRRLEAERRICAVRADRIFLKIGVTGTTTGGRFSRLWRDRHHAYADAAEALSHMNAWCERFGGALPVLVGTVPDRCRTVSANPPTAADIAARHYGYRTLPTDSGSGGYVPDLQRLADRPRWTMPSVVAHELLPGHMVQLPMEADANPHPLRLEYAPGFAEGWAIYAERRVAETGFYATDEMAELGYLHWRLFRIGRALADLDIHLNGLSTDAAHKRLVTWQGEPAYFAPFDTELTRIVQEPMTRASEMLAALAIEDGARGRSPHAIHAYHAAVLTNGRMRTELVAQMAWKIE